MRVDAHISRHDVFLYAACLAFSLDAVANYFASAPIFVGAIPALAVTALLAIRKQRVLLLTILSIMLVVGSFLFNVARFGLNVDNISDVLFLVLLLATLGASISGSPSRRALTLSSILFAALFIPAFFGVNNNFGNTDALTSGSTDIEFLRAYNQGLYRLPHLAAYMLAFGAMWWFMLWERDRKALYAVFSLGFAVMCLYTGSRTPVFLFILGFAASFFSLSYKKIFVLALLIAAIFVSAANIDSILAATEGTFLYQYPSAVKTALTNFDRLSRVMIWTSWFSAIQEFGFTDYLFGRSFAQSLEYNRIHMGLEIWFHNDFLSAIYSYGVPAFMAYTTFLTAAILQLLRGGVTKGKIVFATFIVMSGFVNGFYKYLPAAFLLGLSFTHYSVTPPIRDDRNHGY